MAIIKKGKDGKSQLRLNKSEAEALLKIYIGQNVREQGILAYELDDYVEEVKSLLTHKLVLAEKWYKLYLLKTSVKGSGIAKTYLLNKIENDLESIISETKDFPTYFLSFLINYYLPINTAYPVTPLDYPGEDFGWQDLIVEEGRLWHFRNRLFKILERHGLCVETPYYVSSKRGDIRDSHYVITTAISESLKKKIELPDVPEGFIKTAKMIFLLEEIYPTITEEELDEDDLRDEYHDLLKEVNLEEADIEKMINHLHEEGFTSKYRGILSSENVFDVYDEWGLSEYLEGLKSEAIENLKKGSFKTLISPVGSKDQIDESDRATLYTELYRFENELRTFIKEQMGKGWKKRLEKELSPIFDKLNKRMDRDDKFGIKKGKDLLEYATAEDYIEIIDHYTGVFFDNDKEWQRHNIAMLMMWRRHGRNPIMHCKEDIDISDFEDARIAMRRLRHWFQKSKEMKAKKAITPPSPPPSQPS